MNNPRILFLSKLLCETLFSPFFSTGLGLAAKPIKFDFKDPKSVNNVIFQMDAPLESINGSGDGISGMVHFDPNDPSSTQGTILLDSASLHVGNPVLKEHIHGSDWMNVKKYPTISFKLSKLENIRKKGIERFRRRQRENDDTQRHHRNDCSNQDHLLEGFAGETQPGPRRLTRHSIEIHRQT